MDIVTIVNWVTTVTLIIGVGFTIMQLRINARQQRREAVIELVQSFRTPQFTEALDIVSQLEPGISHAELTRRVGDKISLVSGLGASWESFGILVYRGDIPIGLFEDFFSGPILFSWAVMEEFVMHYRKIVQRDTVFEWFQWLAERVAEREQKMSPVPAHIEFRNWRAPRGQ